MSIDEELAGEVVVHIREVGPRSHREQSRQGDQRHPGEAAAISPSGGADCPDEQRREHDGHHGLQYPSGRSRHGARITPAEGLALD